MSARRLGIEGEDLKGSIRALIFSGKSIWATGCNLGDRVAVIGGGNVAMDAVRTALRTGAPKPFIIYRRSLEEMPANAEEIEECREEGIEIMTLTNPVRIIGEERPGQGHRMHPDGARGAGRQRPATPGTDSRHPSLSWKSMPSFRPSARNPTGPV